MKIIFKTNIDAYKTNCFPNFKELVPRIGEKVMVDEVFLNYFSNLKLPLRLEVVDVNYGQKHGNEFAVCELHFNKTDLEIAIQAGAEIKIKELC